LTVERRWDYPVATNTDDTKPRDGRAFVPMEVSS
jgi:hypothetical protein